MRVTNALVRAARLAPGQTATIEGDLRYGWAETRDRVARLAAMLAARGVVAGDRVAVLSANGIGFFEAWFAVPWAGAVIVPLNTRLAVPELDFQLRDAGVALLLHDRGFADTAQQLLRAGAVAAVLEPGSEAIARELAATAPLPEYAGTGALAGIFYTGGTTGLPKGVMLSHANLASMALNLLVHVDFRPGDVLFHAAPMFHLADIGTLFATMAAGTHVFRASFDAATMLSEFQRTGTTHSFTVPVMIERLTREAERGGHRLPDLRYLGYGGSPITEAALERARLALPGVGFLQGYGQTEFPAITCLTAEDHRPGADPLLLRSCGRTCVGNDIRILDEDGRECEAGVVGEIVARGDAVMLGYLGRPEETAAVLRDGWVHTGDAGWMNAQGYVFITDRLKDMIITGAENVYSIEVENALAFHPAVLECAVIGLPDPEWGERVHAVVVLAEGAPRPAEAELAGFCRARIAGYKVPRSFAFREQPLPRSAAGKVLKRELRDG